MFENFSESEIWLLLAAAMAASFYLGRSTASAPAEVRARLEHMAQASAAEDFRRLPAERQAEVDRLVAAGRIIDAVKLIRATLNLGLYEAKQIVDSRRAGGA